MNLDEEHKASTNMWSGIMISQKHNQICTIGHWLACRSGVGESGIWSPFKGILPVNFSPGMKRVNGPQGTEVLRWDLPCLPWARHRNTDTLLPGWEQSQSWCCLWDKKISFSLKKLASKWIFVWFLAWNEWVSLCTAQTCVLSAPDLFLSKSLGQHLYRQLTFMADVCYAW